MKYVKKIQNIKHINIIGIFAAALAINVSLPVFNAHADWRVYTIPSQLLRCEPGTRQYSAGYPVIHGDADHNCDSLNRVEYFPGDTDSDRFDLYNMSPGVQSYKLQGSVFAVGYHPSFSDKYYRATPYAYKCSEEYRYDPSSAECQDCIECEEGIEMGQGGAEGGKCTSCRYCNPCVRCAQGHAASGFAGNHTNMTCDYYCARGYYRAGTSCIKCPGLGYTDNLVYYNLPNTNNIEICYISRFSGSDANGNWVTEPPYKCYYVR